MSRGRRDSSTMGTLTGPCASMTVSQRIPTFLLVALLALAFALALGDPAHAVSRQKADQIAINVLKTKSKKDVILFRDSRRLHPTGTVTFATRNRVPVTKKGFPEIGKRAWLYWQDLVPYAGFEHRSEMLVIDDKTGRVLQRKKLLYYPIVNGRPPPYLRSTKAYSRKKFKAFEKMAPAVSAKAAGQVENDPLRSEAARIWERAELRAG